MDFEIKDGIPPPAAAQEDYSIRYEGGDADRHEIELSQLGVSLQGFARILAVCAHLAHTGKYNKQYDALSVRVYASPAPEHHCYEVLTQIKDIALSKELWSGFGGVTLTLLVQHVFNRGKEEEMKHLSEALKQSLGQNASMVDRLMSTIEKMADALRPAAKQAVAPVGSSCTSIGIYRSGNSTPVVVVDQATKDALLAAGNNAIEATREFTGVISEMDMETGNCRVTLDGDTQGTRTVATITDPVARTAGNVYAVSMAQIKPLKFLAKTEVDPEGAVVRLYISDVVEPKI